MKKRILGLLLSFAMLMASVPLAIPTPAAATTTPKVKLVQSKAYNLEGVLAMDLICEGIDSIKDISFSMQLDTSVVHRGMIIDSNYSTQRNDSSMILSYNRSYNTPVAVSDMTSKIPLGEDGCIMWFDVRLKDGMTYNNSINMSSITITTGDGTQITTSEGFTPVAYSSSKPKSFRYLVGDANGDYTVNSADMTVINSYVQIGSSISGNTDTHVTAEECTVAADADIDGDINSADKTMIRSMERGITPIRWAIYPSNMVLPTPTATPQTTPSPTPTATPIVTPSPTTTSTPTPTPIATATPVPTPTPTATPTASPTATPTATPQTTPSPTPTPTVAPTASPSPTPTASPLVGFTYIVGDVNGDESVNSSDEMLLRRHVAE